MKLGPIQEAWVKSLEDHPERQIAGHLGKGTEKRYKACCLGEGLVCLYRLGFVNNPFTAFGIMDSKQNESTHTGMLAYSYHKLGLRSGLGSLSAVIEMNGEKYQTLSSMNDRGRSWAEIAAFIRENPEKVFTKSV